MRRMVAFFGGLLSGGAIGTTLVLLFTPTSGGAMRRGLRARYEQAVLAGQIASAQKRLELEAQLVDLTAPHPTGSPLAAPVVRSNR
jgi:gas vesicle protein